MIAYRVGKDGERFLAPSDEWQRWLRVADAIQCNERECIAYVPDSESVEESVAAVFRGTPLKLLVLTKGERGATVYTSAGEVIDVPPVQIDAVVDPTGCGDVFGSFFSRKYVETGNIAEAGALAARAAAFVAGMPGAHGIERLPLLLQGIIS
jgi:sugar/nucleoside kinase (ribokinase family)